MPMHGDGWCASTLMNGQTQLLLSWHLHETLAEHVPAHDAQISMCISPLFGFYGNMRMWDATHAASLRNAGGDKVVASRCRGLDADTKPHVRMHTRPDAHADLDMHKHGPFGIHARSPPTQHPTAAHALHRCVSRICGCLHAYLHRQLILSWLPIYLTYCTTMI